MRKSDLLLLALAVQLGLLFLLFMHAVHGRADQASARSAAAAMVERYALTDLCLFSEASYTRWPSQADLHTPFQDGPFSMEHFPSGSLVPPPATIPGRARVD